jgi:hypothetical protein
MGIERLEAPFDGDQSLEGAAASYMDGMIVYNIRAIVNNNDNCNYSGSNGMTI